jgi:radical SAM protein with 4Fe4S-binding SPASM domain
VTPFESPDRIRVPERCRLCTAGDPTCNLSDTSIHPRVPIGLHTGPVRPFQRHLRLRARTHTIDLSRENTILVPSQRVPRGSQYLDLRIRLDLPWSETGRYEHSRLTFAVDHLPDFDSATTVCLHVPRVEEWQMIRVRLPDAVKQAHTVRIRFEPAPLATTGHASLSDLCFVDAGALGPQTRFADLEALKDRVRQQAAHSELSAAVVLPHMPQSVSIELTARCNLTCTHCSSHGTPELHRRYNKMPEMPVPLFEQLADEVFPSLTSVGLVGRGEPLLVSPRLWNALCSKLIEHGVRLTLVTNGTLVPRRITADVTPLLETVHLSVDGGTESTFAVNRGGAALKMIFEALDHLNALRRAADLCRRPRIGVSWTLKANNVAELPRFVERAIDSGIDQLTVRHLLIFHQHSRSESVVDRPDLVNEPLRKTYRLLEEAGIRSDCPPLIAEPPRAASPKWDLCEPDRVNSNAVRVTVGRKGSRDGCMFVHRTAVVHADGLVPTCSAPFAATAGHLKLGGRFGDIWNGEVLQSVRQSLDTTEEWDQCRNCWYREGRYQAQRAAFDSNETRYDVSEPDEITSSSWDFEKFRQ